GILSYSDAATPYSPETSPKNVYNSLTGLFSSGTTTPADYSVLQGNSIMDCVKGDLDTLKGMDMSMSDKQSLSNWQDLLRTTEIKTVSAACNSTSATNLGISSTTVASATA